MKFFKYLSKSVGVVIVRFLGPGLVLTLFFSGAVGIGQVIYQNFDISHDGAMFTGVFSMLFILTVVAGTISQYMEESCKD